MNKRLVPITLLTGLILCALPAAAQIIIVNDDNSTFGNAVPGLGPNTHTVSFDAGATADKLIVALSSETGGSGPPVITYNGVALTQVPGTGNNRIKGIWYLDNPFTGGPADLVIDMTSYDVVNGIGFGVVSVSGAAPGTTGGDAAGGLEVSITTTAPGSLIVSGYASNAGGLPVVPTGDNQLYSSGNIGSADGAAAYRVLAPGGVQTITYAQTSASGNSTSAAGFAPVNPTVAVVASAQNGITAQTGNTNTISGFTVGPDSDGKLVLAASWEQGNEAISATWNGTESFEVAVNSDGGRNSAVLYLDDPTPGTGDIVVTFGANTGSRVGVLSLAGAVDGVANTSVSNGSTGSLDVPVGGSLVVGVYTSNTNPLFTDPPAFTTTLYSGDSGSSTGNAGYQAEPAGLRTFTWTSTNGSGDNNALAAFLPVAAAPVIVTTSPANGALGVAVDADLVATFSEPVTAGTGNIELWETGGASALAIYDVTSAPEITILDDTLTINPGSDLSLSTSYYILIDAGALVDLSGGDAFAGLAGTEEWNFSAVGQAWDGGDADDNWTSVLNWDADVSPDFAKPIAFVGDVRNGPNNDRTADAVVGGINFANDGSSGNTNAFTLTGNRLTLGGDIVTAASSSGIQDNLNLDMILDGNRTLTTGSDHNLRANNVISEDASARTLIKAGEGLLTLAVANSYSGGTEITAGTVQLIETVAAGTGTITLGDTTGSADAELRINATGTNPTNALTVNAGSSGTKTISGVGTNTNSFAGNITSNDDLTIRNTKVGGSFTISGTNTIAASKTVAFLITGSKNTTHSADWSGDGSISYTADAGSAGLFNITGTNNYSGGTTLGTMSGTGIVIAQNSTAFGTGPLSIGATQLRTGGGSDITFGNTVTFVGDPTFTTRVNETSLIFTGNASLGATRTLTVETGSTEAGESVDFQGEISGSGFGITKAGAGTLTLSGANTYDGDTTVNTGVLSVTGTSIADSGKLVINGSGIVDLTNTETVAALDFDATPQPDGNYSASSVPAGATITTASFSGAGTLTVGAAPTDPYTLWAAANAPTGTPEDDFDGDGVRNGVEFVLGGLATTNDLDKLPTTAADGTNMTFSFDRAVSSIDAKTLVTIEVSTDLETWDTPPSPYAVPDSATGPVDPGVTVVEDTSPGFDTVTLTVPQDAAKKFARLKVVITP